MAKQPKWALCPKCSGSGKHVHDALSVWTSERILEDPDGFEDMRRGAYDVTCTECRGLRVIDVSANASATRSQSKADRRLAAMEDGNFEAMYDNYGCW